MHYIMKYKTIQLNTIQKNLLTKLGYKVKQHEVYQTL